MSDTVRTLIRDAFQRSTVRGLGDTPDEHETKDALSMLNEILDVLSRKEDLSTGNKQVILDVPPKGYLTFSENPHRVFSATVDNSRITCLCSDAHELSVGDEITLRIGGIDIETSVYGVNSFREFYVPHSGMLTGNYIGSFKLKSEPDEYLIDFIMPPPVNIFQVIGSGIGEMPECKEQYFYSVNRSGTWWFYQKGNNPYPKLHVCGSSRIKVVFPVPLLNNVTLDTDISNLDPALRSALKYRLAAEIAAGQNMDAKEKSMLARYKQAFGTYVRSQAQSADPEPDTSMPGYGHGSYNIFTDGPDNDSF